MIGALLIFLAEIALDASPSSGSMIAPTPIPLSAPVTIDLGVTPGGTSTSITYVSTQAQQNQAVISQLQNVTGAPGNVHAIVGGVQGGPGQINIYSQTALQQSGLAGTNPTSGGFSIGSPSGKSARFSL